MSVEDLNVIDLVSIDKNERVILTISDHLEWDKANSHLLKLQDKINLYLAAIENKSLYEVYPDAKGRNIVISVVSKYFPGADGEIFLQRTKEVLEAAGYGFQFTNLIKKD
jgi:hypothetical protein